MKTENELREELKWQLLQPQTHIDGSKTRAAYAVEDLKWVLE